MRGDRIWINGTVCSAEEAGLTVGPLLATDYIYHPIRSIAGKVAFGDDVADICESSCRTIYGLPAGLNKILIDNAVRELMRANSYPHGNLWLTLYLLAPGNHSDGMGVMVDCTGVPVYDEFVWWHTTLRATVKTYEYPLWAHMTSISRNAHSYATGFAERAGYDAVLCSRESGEIVSCGDRPIFASAGKQIITTPVGFGCADSALRRAVLKAASKAGFKISETPVLAENINDYQELFTVDPRGIISIREISGPELTNSAARIIARTLNTVR